MGATGGLILLVSYSPDNPEGCLSLRCSRFAFVGIHPLRQDASFNTDNRLRRKEMMDSQKYASPVISPFGGMGGPGKAIPSFQVSAFPAFFVANPSLSGAHVRRIHVGLEACPFGLKPQGTQRRNLVFAKHLQVLDL